VVAHLEDDLVVGVAVEGADGAVLRVAHPTDGLGAVQEVNLGQVKDKNFFSLQGSWHMRLYFLNLSDKCMVRSLPPVDSLSPC
jgi:hypothetical protein